MNSWAGMAAENSIKTQLATESLQMTGVLRLKVNGWSMLPTIWPGDTVVIRAVDYNNIVTGEIAFFRRGDDFYIHRVLKKLSSNEILSRGDAMPHSDPPFASGELLGKIELILRQGSAIEPCRRLSPAQRLAAGVMQRSESAARFAVMVRQLCRDLHPSYRVDSLCQP